MYVNSMSVNRPGRFTGTRGVIQAKWRFDNNRGGDANRNRNRSVLIIDRWCVRNRIQHCCAMTDGNSRCRGLREALGEASRHREAPASRVSVRHGTQCQILYVMRPVASVASPRASVNAILGNSCFQFLESRRIAPCHLLFSNH